MIRKQLEAHRATISNKRTNVRKWLNKADKTDQRYTIMQNIHSFLVKLEADTNEMLNVMNTPNIFDTGQKKAPN